MLRGSTEHNFSFFFPSLFNFYYSLIVYFCYQIGPGVFWLLLAQWWKRHRRSESTGCKMPLKDLSAYGCKVDCSSSEACTAVHAESADVLHIAGMHCLPSCPWKHLTEANFILIGRYFSDVIFMSDGRLRKRAAVLLLLTWDCRCDINLTQGLQRHPFILPCTQKEVN